MLSRLSKKSDPKHILVVSQTNIGDVVLTCPVIDILRRDFPRAKIDVVVGPKALSLFEDNPYLGVKLYDKRASLINQIKWFMNLNRVRYDCVVDLRRTALALFLRPKYSTPLTEASTMPEHKRDIHLNRLRQVYDFHGLSPQQYSVFNTNADEIFFEGAVAPVLRSQRFVVIAPGAASANKRWNPQGFAMVADFLSATHKVVFVGDDKDAGIVDEIQGQMKSLSLSLAGKINLRQLAYVLKKCSWALTHDSGVMHLACYFNVPVLALWGPTDINRYAPWSSKSVVVRRNEKCLRCQNLHIKDEHNCMSFIKVEEVIHAISRLEDLS